MTTWIGKTMTKGSADYIAERQRARQLADTASMTDKFRQLEQAHVRMNILEMVFDNVNLINRKEFHEVVELAYGMFSDDDEAIDWREVQADIEGNDDASSS